MEDTNNGSLKDLIKVFTNIGTDVKKLFVGVRENWWKLRQMLILDRVPDVRPSKLFNEGGYDFSENPELSADDENPVLVYSNKTESFYNWNPDKSAWKRVSFSSNPVSEEEDGQISLTTEIGCLTKTLSGTSELSFDISALNKDVLYTFTLVFNTAAKFKAVEFVGDNVKWDGDEALVVDKNKTYFIDVRVLDGKIYLKQTFSCSTK